MPVQKLRRIAPLVGASLHDRLCAQTLHHADWPRSLDALEREHPELIIVDGDNVLAASGRGSASLS
jgi:hypothetical protein